MFKTECIDFPIASAQTPKTRRRVSENKYDTPKQGSLSAKIIE
jgi:hypothetical protein